MTVVKDYGETYAKLPTAEDDYVFAMATAEGDTREFVVCDVFLESVLNAAQPDPDGWHGILLEYHCNMAWLDKPWAIPDISALVFALRSVPSKSIAEQPFGDDALRILPELLSFLAEADRAGHQVVLSKT